MTVELKNERGFPEKYYARHMESGLCGYEAETILVDGEAMKAMAASFNNKPVYVGHQDVDVENLRTTADGYVTKCFYNELDGWLWAEMIIISDAAKDAIAKGWSVSNAYRPSEFARGGQHHNVDFHRKILNAVFTHLAIVPDPRYEGAKIFTEADYKAYCETKRAEIEELKNSKQRGVTKMFKKIFKTEQKEITNAADLEGATVELNDGTTVTLADMIEAVELRNAKMKKNAEGADKEKDGDKEKANKKMKLNSDTEVDVGGEKMPLSDLMNRYSNAMKENAAEEEDKKKKEDEEKKNAEEKKKEEDEKANSKHFAELKNAREKAASAVKVVDTSIDQMQRGKDLYGSSK